MHVILSYACSFTYQNLSLLAFRWNSQQACLNTFVRNYDIYCRIVDDNTRTPTNIKSLLDNRGLVSEAKNMLKQLEQISFVLNKFQVRYIFSYNMRMLPLREYVYCQ